MKNKPSGPPHHKKKQPRKGGGHGGAPSELNTIAALIITGKTEEGELVAEPAKWEGRRRPPQIIITESGRQAAVTVGDKVLAKMRRIRHDLYQALVIRTLPSETPQPVLGVLVVTATGGIIEPVNRRTKESYMVARADMGDAQHGELVSAMTQPGTPSMGMTYARITERLGRLDSPKAASLIASHMHSLPSVFSEAAIAESEAAPAPVMEPGREDLRDFPLVTIDGADARDFDDAVFAERDGEGWHLLVAIADVAHYVTEGSALDEAAFERGNSVYFPDRVIPMLPERLSNGLCSLKPDEDRYCMAVHIWIDAHGVMHRYKFVRGLMRSRARLTYEKVEAHHKENTEPLTDTPVIAPLFAAYGALAAERDKRGALDLNLPEYKIIFDASGNVATISPKERLESHRLIECFMIAANVAAADWLLKKKQPAIYRVHEPPSEEKLEDLISFLKMAGYSLSKGAGVTAAHFNRVLKRSEDQPNANLIHTSVLRSQMQAYYAAENLGHFGLSLQKYCHFTSPIRRYADLIVHRALIASLGDGEKQKPSALQHIALHISDTERKAMMAERDASDRYKVSYMTRQLGNTFAGTISGLNEYGLFITLADNGVTGFIPVRGLPGDFYHYDKQHKRFQGQRSRRSFTIGDLIMIRVLEANAITGSLIFAPEGTPLSEAPPLRPKHKTGHQPPHKPKKDKKFKNKGKRDHKKSRNRFED